MLHFLKTPLLTRTVLLFLALTGALLVSSIAVSSPVEAKLKTDNQIQTEAERFCGKGDGPIARACRTGYRAGYGGTTARTDACDSAQYNNSEKTRCREGYDSAAKLKAKDSVSDGDKASVFGNAEGKYQCGKGKDTFKTKFNFGCLGNKATSDISPLEDLIYAIIRFMSVGIGLLVVASIVYAGIQYSASEGKPDAAQQAKNRVRNSIIGLIVYIFAFALIQYLVPGGLFG